jgi:hypothetical protein
LRQNSGSSFAYGHGHEQVCRVAANKLSGAITWSPVAATAAPAVAAAPYFKDCRKNCLLDVFAFISSSFFGMMPVL